MKVLITLQFGTYNCMWRVVKAWCLVTFTRPGGHVVIKTQNIKKEAIATEIVWVEKELLIHSKSCCIFKLLILLFDPWWCQLMSSHFYYFHTVVWLIKRMTLKKSNGNKIKRRMCCNKGEGRTDERRVPQRFPRRLGWSRSVGSYDNT